MTRGRSGWGLHRAVAGGRRAEEGTHGRCLEAIEKLNACASPADFSAVVAWIKSHDWFLRRTEDDKVMHAAFDEAYARVRMTGGTKS